MQVEIAKDTSKKVDKVSKLLGIGESQLVESAILLYLDKISKYLNLKKEMNKWDSLSDKALMNFEKSL